MIDINVGIPPAAPGFWSPQVIAAFISGFIALITAGVVSAITIRQWKTQNDKLLMDLFDKRFENFRTVMGAVATPNDGGKGGEGIGAVMKHMPATPMESFYRAAAVSHFLFGEDVAAALRALERALVGLEAARTAPLSDQDDPLGDAREALDAATLDYIEACQPYMMMGHIAAKGRTQPGRPALEG